VEENLLEKVIDAQLGKKFQELLHCKQMLPQNTAKKKNLPDSAAC
jgi:hypothetical protein